MEEWRTMRGSGQIPAFGNWDYVNELPITQYFDCPRHAGLIRYSSSSAESDPNSDLYAVDGANYHHRPPPSNKGREKRGAAQVNYNKNGNKNKNKGEGNIVNSRKHGAGKVFNVTVTEFPTPSDPALPTAKRHSTSGVIKKQPQYTVGSQSQPRRPPRAVDEDLYKIPPELLKRRRRLWFISRCLVPPCAV